MPDATHTTTGPTIAGTGAPAARGRLVRAFTEHPASVDETYLEHARFALGFAGRLFLASLAALVHAVLPFLFETTASRAIGAMHARIVSRR